MLVKEKNQVFNFVKLCSVRTDEVTKYHFVDLLRIYREAQLLIASRHLSSENEKVNLKSVKNVTSLEHCSLSIFLKTL